MKTFFLSLALLVLLFVSQSALSNWKIDKAHSNVDFSVTHLVISEVRGSFNDFNVTIEQPEEDFTKATIEAKIKTASVFTDSDTRDKHLRSDDFFNAERFPEMTFKSTSITKTGEDQYAITGDLTIRDVTKEVVLDAKYLGQIKDPWGNTKVGFKATTKIDRFEFGTKWNKLTETGGLVVGKEVSIALNIQMVKQKANEKKES